MLPFTGHIYIVVLLIVVLIIFGPKRLPELGNALGRALREFRQATTELREQVSTSVDAPAETRTTTTDVTERPAAQTETRA